MLALACSPIDGVQTSDHSLSTERFGVLGVVRAESLVPGAEEQIVITGVFARQRGFERSLVLDLASLPDVPDPELFALENNRCQVVDRTGGQAPDADEFEAFVDLLDAGDVQVGFGEGGRERLRRRPFPELWAAVNGVTYEGTAPIGAADGPIALLGRGSPELGDFQVRRALPAVPTLRAVSREPVTTGYASIDWADDLDVRWSPPPTEEPDVRLIISLEALQYDRTVALRCVTRDTGSALLPVAGVAEVARLATRDATVRLVIRRVAHVRFAVSGLHEADAYFVSRGSVLLK